MQLVGCAAPEGAEIEQLQPAPLTALVPQEQSDAWSGFWSGDEGETYLARFEPGDGREVWFRLEDSPPRAAIDAPSPALARAHLAREAAAAAPRGTRVSVPMVWRADRPTQLVWIRRRTA